MSSAGVATDQGPDASSRHRLRILHFIPTLEGGGAERQLSYLAEAHAAMGHEVHVGLLRDGPNSGRVHRAGALVHPLSNRGHYDPALLWRAHRLLRRIRPDIVQTWLPLMDVIGGTVARLNGIPWILSERSAGSSYTLGLKNRLRRTIARGAALIVANSNAGVEYWTTAGHGRPRLVIPNAIPVAELRGSANDVPVDSTSRANEASRKFLLYVGRLVPGKNLSYLVMALARVLVEVDADALLCGDGPDREALERQIKALGMTDRIRMLGYRDDVASLMRRATALVFVSLVEGQPNSVLEAMATGCPLIVSDIPQHRGFLSDESAMFVDPQSPSSIADGVRRLLNDLPAAHQRAIRAYDIAVHQNVNHIATRYTEVYIAAGRRASIEVGR